MAIWRQIALTDGLESRAALQAWHFVRQAGQSPPGDLASRVLGAVAEVPINRTHDLLAAYQDGTARYLNHAGGAVIWEGHEPSIQAAIDDWLVTAQGLARVIGTWDQPSLPHLGSAIPATASGRAPAGAHAHPRAAPALAKGPMRT